MTFKDPPRIAAWMLEHLTFGGKNEALTGDLLEEFRRGRSVIWYWRQVLVAIVVAVARVLRQQWMAVAYTLLWAIPFPAFLVLVVENRVMEVPLFAGRWQLDWPYSMICDLLLFYGPILLYLWLALVVYLGLFSFTIGIVDWSRLAKSLWISASVFAVISVAQLGLFLLLPRPTVHILDRRHVTALHLMMGSFFWELRLPIFLSLLLSILMALPRVEKATNVAT